MATETPPAPPIEPPVSPDPVPAPPSSAAGADTAVAEALKGTLLGGLLDPDKPLFDGSYMDRKGEKRDEKPAPKPDEKPPVAPAAPEAAQPDKVVKKPERKPPSKPAAREAPVDVEKIAVAAAAATLEAQQRLKMDEERRRLETQLPPEVAKYAGIYDEMHRSNPEKYPADLKLRMARYVQEERARASKWEAAHPGETYNHDDEEHESWYEANRPKVDDDDFDDARISIKAEQKAREIVSREVGPATQELHDQLQRQTIGPELAEKANSLDPVILKAVVPAIDGPVNKEVVDKLEAEDPIAIGVARRVKHAFGAIVVEAGLMWKGLKKYDENNPAHTAAKKVVEEFEEQLSSMDPGELRKGKQQWAPLATYARMSAADRANHYVIEYDDMVNYIRTHVAPSEARRIYDLESEQSKTLVDRLAKKFGYQKGSATTSSQSTPPPTPTLPALLASPSVSAGAPPPPPGAGVPAGDGSGEDEFFKRMGVR